jgi:hypothetical protein
MNSPPERHADSTAAPFTDPLHEELHRRIEELRAHHEDDFGRFHRFDWILIVLGCVLLPWLLYLRFLP